MPCYHPLYALVVGKKANGKKNLKFISRKIEDSEKIIYYDGKIYLRSALIPLPCGQCIGCRLEYSRQWANRMMLELEYHDSAYFCTFTYDDEHVPRSYYADPETGEAVPALTLDKRDMQLLMKRIREHFPDDKIRFFGCGEYGSQSFRPHFHIILFGLHLDDLVIYKTVRQGGEFYSYYNSDSLARCWLDDKGSAKGYVVVGEVTWETCAYTARYVTKKLKGAEAKFYDDHNIQPEFVLMSRRPGIGRRYYDDHPEIYDYEKINISTPKGGKSFRPPRYYDKLFDLEQPSRSEALKLSRAQLAAEAARSKLQKTSLESNELLEVEESTVSNRIKSLRRKDL